MSAPYFDECSTLNIPSDLKHAINLLEQFTGETADLNIININIGLTCCAVISVEGMASSQLMAELVFQPLTDFAKEDNTDADSVWKFLTEESLMTSDRQITLSICTKKSGGGYEGKKSIFDEMTPDDLVLAFFPCVRFETKIMLYFKGKATGQKNWDLEKKLNYSMKLHSELHENYMLISKLVIICLRKHIQLVIENPFSTPNYLEMYWPVQPSVIDRDRRRNGDYHHKPTQYFFINREPLQNILNDPMPINMTYRSIDHINGSDGIKREVIRSMISPVYANRFIRTYLIEDKQ